VTTPPIIPGFHYYTLLVDGASFNDPSSETFFGASRELSDIRQGGRGVPKSRMRLRGSGV
jgi:hypothetical protein